MKVIAVHIDRCTGCRTCELYCGTERGSAGKTLLAAAQETPVPQARLRVEGDSSASLPMQCRHCADAPCLDACLTGALVRDAESGVVHVDQDRCIGCWTCVMFCPYGVIFPWPEQKFALKCDRCLHREAPTCVEVCPTQALELVDTDELATHYAEKRKVVARTAAEFARADGITLLALGG